MALTKITAKSVKDDAITTEQIAHSTITNTNLADDSCTQAKIADEAVDEARLQVSNAGTNGQFLQKQSGDTGGLTWATVTVPDSDKIEEGNTSIETVDTGSDGHVKITTEGTERTRFTSNGKILIGEISTPFSTTSYRKVQIGQADGGWINLARTGVPADGNHLGAIQGFSKGADGTYHPVAGFDLKADGTPSNTSKPSRIEIYTTPASSTTQTERFRVGSAGQLGVAGANYGTSGQVLTSGGASAAPSWADAGGGGFSNMTSLTSGSSASWSIPSGVSTIKVYCTGGGGGGGRGNSSTAAGSGGAGGTSIHYFDVSSGGTATYTIGNGGSGTNSDSQYGNSGGSSTFAYGGTTITGGGGTGGGGPNIGTANDGGAGGTASGGTLNLTGGAGGPGMRAGAAYRASTSPAGTAYWGGSTAAKGVESSNTNSQINNLGCGGVGGIDYEGQNGSSGIIIIEY